MDSELLLATRRYNRSEGIADDRHPGHGRRTGRVPETERSSQIGKGALSWCLCSVAVLVLSSAVSCIHRQRYPITWPAIAAVGEGACPDLSGTYSDVAEAPAGSTSSEEVRLSALLLQRAEWHPKEIAGTRAEHNHAGTVSTPHVDLSLSTANLEIRGGGELVVIPRKRFSCGKDGLKLQLYSDAGGVPLFAFGQSAAVFLAKDDDGALVVRLREIDIAWIVVPFYERQSKWLRFPAVGIGRISGVPAGTPGGHRKRNVR